MSVNNTGIGWMNKPMSSSKHSLYEDLKGGASQVAIRGKCQWVHSRCSTCVYRHFLHTWRIMYDLLCINAVVNNIWVVPYFVYYILDDIMMYSLMFSNALFHVCLLVYSTLLSIVSWMTVNVRGAYALMYFLVSKSRVLNSKRM